MRYNIEVSVNIIKETKISEIVQNIKDNAKLCECNQIYMLTEEDGTIKIPRYNIIYVILFENDNNIIKFIKNIKKYKSINIECIYDNNLNKLLYASSFYLMSIDKELSKQYKTFIKDRNFSTPFNIKNAEFNLNIFSVPKEY